MALKILGKPFSDFLKKNYSSIVNLVENAFNIAGAYSTLERAYVKNMKTALYEIEKELTNYFSKVANITDKNLIKSKVKESQDAIALLLGTDKETAEKFLTSIASDIPQTPITKLMGYLGNKVETSLII